MPGSYESAIFSILVIFGVFILPFILGAALSKTLRMPTHSVSFGIILATIIGSCILISYGKLRKGVDIDGGTILEYEIDKTVQGNSKNVKSKDLINRLMERINPGGLNEIVIRPIGNDRLEVIVPNKDQFEIDEVKRKLQEAGILKFRIVANRTDHRTVIDLATAQASNPDQGLRLSNEVIDSNGNVVGVWHTVGTVKEEREGVHELLSPIQGDIVRDTLTGRILTIPPGLEPELGVEKYLKREGIANVDILTSLVGRDGKPFDVVTGDDIQSVTKGTGPNGSPEVSFTMKPAGGKRLGGLTGRNQATNGMKRRMAIVLDGRILSAPNLETTIYNRGVIHGNFTQKEVDFLQNILQSGSLPAALGKQPISQQQIGAVLGQATIQKGLFASLLSVIGTLLFVAIYYRFSGLIACVALLLNVLYIYASMLFLQQPITLPGLAGLVLTVGMSVDANVLVFERMREEIQRKSTGRMAIRNGFDRAMTTIIDSNLTTLISAVVLYWLGTDQIKGFAIALIIGILISMFTAVFCSRVLFDVAEKLRILNFSMSDFVAWLRNSFLGQDDVDFMGMRNVCYVISGLVIAIGLIATGVRSKGILDIDFNGGTSVTFSLDKPMNPDDVRTLTEKIFKEDDQKNPIQSTLTNIAFEGADAGKVYRLDTSLIKTEEVVERLKKGFAETGSKLVTYQLKANPKAPKETSFRNVRGNVRLVAYQPPVEAPSSEVAAPAQEPAAAAPQEPAAAPAATPVAPPPTPAPGDKDLPTAEPTTPPALGGAPAAAPAQKSDWELRFSASHGTQSAKINAKSLRETLVASAKKVGIQLTETQLEVYPMNPPKEGWTIESAAGFEDWKVTFPLSTSDTQKVVADLEKSMSDQPVWLSLSNIGERVAGDMQQKAVLALVVSNIFIILYIWVRFQKIAYGLAAVIALLHDVLITLGCLAVCHWLYRPLGFLLIEDFKISLTIVAAFLTIIGYSLNDTIVVFDRIREVKGKSPTLSAKMVNQSVNQTLGRTLLTSSTTLICVMLLYIFGGDGIHGFAYCLFIGIVVGTYSSIFVAAPVLLWLVGREERRAGLHEIRPNRS